MQFMDAREGSDAIGPARPSTVRAPFAVLPRYPKDERQKMRLILVLPALLLAACQSQQPAKSLTPEESAALKPANPRLAGLYEQSCKTCHTVADTGAPLTGDRTKWDARWAKGEPTLLKSAISGVNGMPAGGQCFSCTPDDYRALIRFMAGRN